MLTPKKIYWLFGGAMIVFIVTYLGFQISAFAGSPTLFIDLPPNLILEEATIIIKGQTSRDAKVWINNQELVVDEQGNFKEKIYLLPGENILNFQALNSRGKITFAQRRIFRQSE